MLDMRDAPKNGDRILLKYQVLHFRRPTREEAAAQGLTGHLRWMENWFPSGYKWEECRWIEDHFEPWQGIEHARTTLHISLDHCLGWLRLPEEPFFVIEWADMNPHGPTIHRYNTACYPDWVQPLVGWAVPED